jgi:aromatic-amino-acid transaminase
VLHLIPSHQSRPSDDPIFSLHREATQRKDRGEDVVDASIGVLLDDEGALSILPTVARAVREVPGLEWATYAPIAGTPEFVRAVIDDLLMGEPAMRESAVAVATPGGSGAIRHAITNFLEPGQAALTTSWFWSPYRTLCDESDRKLDTFTMFDDSGRLDVAALDGALERQLAAQGRALVIVNDPAHNPTGYSMTLAEWAALAKCIGKHAARHPVTLLIDCAYCLYGAADRDPLAFLTHLAPLLGRAALLFAWSASKSFTHYGLRVGALVACIGDPAERAKVSAALSYSSRGTWSNCNHGGLSAITRVLVDPEMKKAVNVERAALKAVLSARVDAFNALAQKAGLRYPRYDGGFFVTVFVDRPREQGDAMKTRGVFAVPQVAASGTGGVLRVALCAVASRHVPRLVDALRDSGH